MRYGGEHKAETRARIVRLAARELRQKGPGKVAVADVMAGAGLTHGGFYAHFASKDALVVEAIDTMFADAQARNPALDDALRDPVADVPAALRTYLTAYLAPAHRDRPERGCPLPALSADIARGSATAQTGFAQGLDRLMARIAAALTRMERTAPASEANAVLSQMVGAVALARAVGPGAKSDAILHDALADLIVRLSL